MNIFKSLLLLIIKTAIEEGMVLNCSKEWYSYDINKWIGTQFLEGLVLNCYRNFRPILSL